MGELREAVTRILGSIEKRNKYELAKQLADTLCLVDTADLHSKIQEVLERELTPTEVFAVDTLGLILRDYDLFQDFEPGHEAAKAGAF